MRLQTRSRKTLMGQDKHGAGHLPAYESEYKIIPPQNSGCQDCKHYVLVACNHPDNTYIERTPIGNFNRWHKSPLKLNRHFDCMNFEQISWFQKFWRNLK